MIVVLGGVSWTWQEYRSALEATLLNDYSQGALIILDDPDTGSRKFFVSTILQGVGPDEPEAILSHADSAHCGEIVIGRAVRMFVEFDTKSLTTFSNMVPVILSGLKEGIWEGVKIFFREYDWAGSFADMLASRDTSGTGSTSLKKPALFQVFEEHRKR